MQRFTYVVFINLACPQLREESVVPRPGNDTSCAHTSKIRKWRPSQRTATTGERDHRMAFIDQGEFEAMKSLSGWEAARSDEHQFRSKIKVSTLVVFDLLLLDKWSEQRKKK